MKCVYVRVCVLAHTCVREETLRERERVQTVGEKTKIYPSFFKSFIILVSALWSWCDGVKFERWGENVTFSST